MQKKNINKDKVVKKGKKVAGEFKDFISQGNVIDLAVGVIIGGAFGKIVTSLVNDIIMPAVGMLVGGIDFTGLKTKIGEATIAYGNFIQNVIDFLTVALCIFFFVKIIRSTKSKFDKKEDVVEEKVEEKKDENIVLLEEIRDLLKEKSKK